MKTLSKNKLLTTFYSIFGFLGLISLVLLVVSLFALPFPERFTLDELDPLCIEAGEGTTLILIYVSSAIAIFSYIITFILGSFLLYINTFRESWFYKDIWRNATLSIVTILLFLSTYLVPFIMSWLYITNIVYTRNENINYSCRVIIQKYDNLWSKVFCSTIPIILALTSLTPLFIPQSTTRNVYVNSKIINKFLKLSNTHDNTLMLYFDRAVGMIWNSLLYYDYFKNGDNSFISLFPEFTSYVKSMSQGRQTNTSNPSLVGGAMYSSWMNGYNGISPFDSTNNFANDTINDFWSDAFYNQFNMLKSKGIKNINISSVPYFSYDGNQYCEPTKFDSAVKKVNVDNSLNINLTTNESIAKDKLGYDKGDRLSNAIALKNASDLISFTDQESTYTGWYFHHTHENYCYYNYATNNFIDTKSNKYLGFIQSQWFSILASKELLLKLKSEKHKNGGSVYDNTQIIIISDHGYSITKDDKNLDDLLKFVERQNNLPAFNPVRKSLLAWNNVFLYKPFNEHKNSFTFNDSNLVLSSDLPLIIESELNKIKGIDNTYFYPNFDLIKNEDVKKYFMQLIVKDPLNNLNKLNNRLVRLELSDWKWSNNRGYKPYLEFNIQDNAKWGFNQLFSSKYDFSNQ